MAAHQSATCSFGTNLLFSRALEVTNCVLVVNQISVVIAAFYLLHHGLYYLVINCVL